MKILVCDGNNLVARNTMVFSAAVNSDGVAIGGIYGSVMMIRNHLASHAYDAVVLALDWGRPEFRSQICPEYKAQRAAERTPEEERMHKMYREQCTYIHQVVGPLGIVTARAHNWEGDDVIAALCLHRLRDHECTIFSSDKDYTQLVDDTRVKFFDLTSTDFIPPDSSYVLKRCLDPKASDNLDGVKGVGPKKANWLIESSAATTPDALVAWCAANVGQPGFTPGQVKILNAVVESQEKVRNNWICTNLASVAAKCDAELKFRRTVPDRALFTEVCRQFELRPILMDMSAMFPPFANLQCPV